MWEGMDGKQILSHIFMVNNSAIDPQILLRRWEKDRNQQEDIDTFLFPFGFRDGGPTVTFMNLRAMSGTWKARPEKTGYPGLVFREYREKRFSDESLFR